MTKKIEDNFRHNLKTLSQQAGTVSEICRQLGINRQQFNKYLAGTHVPSRQNINIISAFFNVNVDLLYQNPEDFRTMVEGGHFTLFRDIISAPKMIQFIDNIVNGYNRHPEDILGIYDRYHYSSIYPGKILRSTFCIYERNGILMHYYLERFPDLDNKEKISYRFKYHGLTFHISGRLFCIDFESLRHNEMTFSNLAVIHRSGKKFIFGVTSGIAETMMRQPVSAKVAMSFTEKKLIGRADIRRATILEPDDNSIPKEIINYLNTNNKTIDSSRLF
ncbi:helix-turn-helix domain-containing protein [Pectobacterium brasiliense]|uniref:helix-turn-helix domain-containing protein n=1 Tax=Pectobacterium brasiliense TaxID=180957 RepID=UPI000B96333F|nr:MULTISPECIES: helix-turn-helix transcriptional regulator [Pectobacterium]MCA5917989.1 helix-turn-helix domain-containing protein [Pectobacterium brasiliense]MCA5928394.1 helix-turn-helix domain-containing protein [Pectobacterium brasiliense]MCA5933852.1 helix-turn-helix domain-containing protein [Pectobacterium brasiliense]MCA5938035.1 helix-turn-helix domain-containing protein [Pectobacterium brasiliense]MCA5945741.1 helix-turn-helix domain-containing protein [Pectobacterium brasiliense]